MVNVNEPLKRALLFLCGQAGLKHLNLRAVFSVPFMGVVVSAASATRLTRLDRRSGRKVVFSQGHLWGKRLLAAGGRRLEDAIDGRPKAQEPASLL